MPWVWTIFLIKQGWSAIAVRQKYAGRCQASPLSFITLFTQEKFAGHTFRPRRAYADVKRLPLDAEQPGLLFFTVAAPGEAGTARYRKFAFKASSAN